jgi:hypothetical protein
MKKILITLFIALYSFTSYAQDLNLFGLSGKPTTMALYGAFKLGYQELNDANLEDNRSVSVGLSIGCLFNNNFAIGLYGYTNSEYSYNPTLPYNYIPYNGTYANYGGYLRYGYGGMFMEERIFTWFPVHLNLTLKGGAGSIEYYDNNNTSFTYNHSENDYYDMFYIVEPGAEVEINIVRFFKISGGVSYKFTDPINMLYTPSDILNGYTYNLSFNFIFPNNYK